MLGAAPGHRATMAPEISTSLLHGHHWPPELVLHSPCFLNILLSACFHSETAKGISDVKNEVLRVYILEAKGNGKAISERFHF